MRNYPRHLRSRAYLAFDALSFRFHFSHLLLLIWLHNQFLQTLIGRSLRFFSCWCCWTRPIVENRIRRDSTWSSDCFVGLPDPWAHLLIKWPLGFISPKRKLHFLSLLLVILFEQNLSCLYTLTYLCCILMYRLRSTFRNLYCLRSTFLNQLQQKLPHLYAMSKVECWKKKE